MPLNKNIAVYYLFLICSIAIGLLAAVNGLRVVLRRNRTDSPERRPQREKYLYLCSSAMFTGTVVRVAMIPLWFFMLYSLIPVIPGAMCLVGVHMAVPDYAWIASSMKIVLPWLYVSWIIITVIDRRMADQPFLILRQVLLAPLILLTLIEGGIDIQFLTHIRPTPVTCCTAIFDFNPPGVPVVFNESHWYFVIIFLVCVIFQTMLIIMNRCSRLGYGFSLGMSVWLCISLVLSLHTKLSPLILASPFHHCVFCLLQHNTYVLIGFMLVMFGIYFSFGAGLSGAFDPDALVRSGYLKRIKIVTIVFYITGLVFLAVPTVYYIFQERGGL